MTFGRFLEARRRDEAVGCTSRLVMSRKLGSARAWMGALKSALLCLASAVSFFFNLLERFLRTDLAPARIWIRPVLDP